MHQCVVISAGVEGPVDEAVARRLIAHVGGSPGAVYGKEGKQALCKRIHGYNHAARHAPWLVLVDLNGDADCAPPLRQAWLPNLAPRMCFRIAVRQVEAWLMADREALAKYLSIAPSRIPAAPESLQNAKVEMVNLARQSRHKDVRADMVPRHGSGRAVGPAYTSRLIEFVNNHWRPDKAARNADSLRRAINCLQQLVRKTTSP